MSSPAAWHPDPTGAHEHRYWDGERWTEHVADAGVASIDPLPGGGGSGTEGGSDAASGSAAAVGSDTPAGGEPGGAADATTRPEAGHTDTSPSDDAAATAPAWATGGDTTSTPASGSGQSGPPPAWAAGGGTPPSGGQPAWAGHSSSGPSWDGGTSSPPTGMAITSLVLGIVALPLVALVGFGALVGIAALILGIIVVRRAKRGEAGGRGMGIAGIVLGAISLLLGILVFVGIMAFALQYGEELERCLEETGSQQICQERLERQLNNRFFGG